MTRSVDGTDYDWDNGTPVTWADWIQDGKFKSGNLFWSIFNQYLPDYANWNVRKYLIPFSQCPL